MRPLLFFMVSLLVLSCSSARRATKYREGATLWSLTSGEARALQYQAYNFATLSLRERLSRKGGKGLPPAVILGVDDTVLDNSPYEAWVVATGRRIPEGWTAWLEQGEAKAIPGAVRFLKYAVSKGVTPVYVSDRSYKHQSHTIQHLRKLGFPNVTEQTVLCLNPGEDKYLARGRVHEDYDVLLMVGDSLSDFSTLFGLETPEERLMAVDKHRRSFGTEFVVLPNPMHGDWENVFYDFTELSVERRAELRLRALVTH